MVPPSPSSVQRSSASAEYNQRTSRHRTPPALRRRQTSRSLRAFLPARPREARRRPVRQETEGREGPSREEPDRWESPSVRSPGRAKARPVRSLRGAKARPSTDVHPPTSPSVRDRRRSPRSSPRAPTCSAVRPACPSQARPRCHIPVSGPSRRVVQPWLGGRPSLGRQSSRGCRPSMGCRPSPWLRCLPSPGCRSLLWSGFLPSPGRRPSPWSERAPGRLAWPGRRPWLGRLASFGRRLLLARAMRLASRKVGARSKSAFRAFRAFRECRPSPRRPPRCGWRADGWGAGAGIAAALTGRSGGAPRRPRWYRGRSCSCHHRSSVGAHDFERRGRCLLVTPETERSRVSIGARPAARRFAVESHRWAAT